MGASHVFMEESLAVSSVTRGYCNHSANWGKWCSVNTTTEHLASHHLPISTRTSQINTRIL